MKIRIHLNSIEKIKNFVHETNKLEYSINLSSGKYVVSGKSIMGIFSLDLTQPIEMEILNRGVEIDIIPQELENYIVKNG